MVGGGHGQIGKGQADIRSSGIDEGVVAEDRQEVWFIGQGFFGFSARVCFIVWQALAGRASNEGWCDLFITQLWH